jgi:hypothetical protein
MAKKKRYLIETSAVRAALGETPPQHSRHFEEETRDGGGLSTSVYIRMEFLRRWIRHYANFALQVDHFQNLSHAINYESESFHSRDLKALLHLLAHVSARERQPTGREAAKEIAHIAVTTLRKFDRRFASYTANSCGCKIGTRAFCPDFNNLFAELREFVRSWCIQDSCKINRFLNLGKPSNASKLLDRTEISDDTSAGKALAELKRKGKAVTCKDCQKIGDIVIALEQQAAWCLVHIDSAFNILCEATGRSHKAIKSVKAVEGDVPRRQS